MTLSPQLQLTFNAAHNCSKRRKYDKNPEHNQIDIPVIDAEETEKASERAVRLLDRYFCIALKMGKFS
jgi:hypothetical protein